MTFLEWLSQQTGRADLAGVIARDVQGEIKRIGKPLTFLNERMHFVLHCHSMPVEPKITRGDAIGVFTEYLRECVWPRLDEQKREQRVQKREQQAQKRAEQRVQPRTPPATDGSLIPVRDERSGAALVEGDSFFAIIYKNGDILLRWWSDSPPVVTTKKGKV